MAESQTEKLMRLLKCSKEEAEDIIKTDKMIDRGERTPYDLDPALEKEIKKKYVNSHEKKHTVYNFNKRERKADEVKGEFIQSLKEYLENLELANIVIVNKEREISFDLGDTNFSLTLVRHRKKKGEGE